MISSWILIWVMASQSPVVLTDFATETECRQAVEDVLKKVPKKRNGPKREGFCVPLLATQVGGE